MFNSEEYLLLCFMEELGEIQKEASKCLRFGIHHKQQISDKTNFERLCKEWSELQVILKLMKEHGLNITSDSNEEINKLERLEYFWNFSKQQGIVNEHFYSRLKS